MILTGCLTLLAGMNHAQADRGPHFSLEPAHGFVQAEVLRALPLDLDNPVAGDDPGAVGGRTREGADDPQLPARVDHHPDPDPAKLTLDRGAEAIDLLGTDVARIGIQFGKRPLDRGLDQLAAVHGPHVVPLDLVQRIDQQSLELVNVVLVGGPIRLLLGRWILGWRCRRRLLLGRFGRLRRLCCGRKTGQNSQD